jgi:hypothetical protein
MPKLRREPLITSERDGGSIILRFTQTDDQIVALYRLAKRDRIIAYVVASVMILGGGAFMYVVLTQSMTSLYPVLPPIGVGILVAVTVVTLVVENGTQKAIDVYNTRFRYPR